MQGMTDKFLLPSQNPTLAKTQRGPILQLPRKISFLEVEYSKLVTAMQKWPDFHNC